MGPIQVAAEPASVNVHGKMLVFPVPEKFNTFSKFNTFNTFTLALDDPTLIQIQVQPVIDARAIPG